MTQKEVVLKKHENIYKVSNILTDDCGCWPGSSLIVGMGKTDTVSTEWEGHVSCAVS